VAEKRNGKEEEKAKRYSMKYCNCCKLSFFVANIKLLPPLRQPALHKTLE